MALNNTAPRDKLLRMWLSHDDSLGLLDRASLQDRSSAGDARSRAGSIPMRFRHSPENPGEPQRHRSSELAICRLSVANANHQNRQLALDGFVDNSVRTNPESPKP